MTATARTIVVLVRPNGDPEHGETDRAAVARARSIANGIPGGTVAVLTWGSAQTEPVLRRLLAAGADRAARIDLLEDAEPLVVARLVAEGVVQLGAVMVLCGEQGVSADATVSGYELAAALGWRVLNDCVTLDAADARRVRAVQWSELGDRSFAEADLPLVCLVRREIGRPMYVAVSRETRFQDAPVEILTVRAPADAAEEIAAEFGEITRKLIAPKIRVKKKKESQIATKPLTAAERRKALSGGSRRPVAGSSGPAEADGPLTGAPDDVAKKVVAFLATKELLDG